MPNQTAATRCGSSVPHSEQHIAPTTRIAARCAQPSEWISQSASTRLPKVGVAHSLGSGALNIADDLQVVAGMDCHELQPLGGRESA